MNGTGHVLETSGPGPGVKEVRSRREGGREGEDGEREIRGGRKRMAREIRGGGM